MLLETAILIGLKLYLEMNVMKHFIKPIDLSKVLMPNLGFIVITLLLFYMSADVFTFIYFHPRNDIMFLSEKLPDTETLKRLASEWSSMNWLRSLIVLLGIISSFFAIHKIYTEKVT